MPLPSVASFSGAPPPPPPPAAGAPSTANANHAPVSLRRRAAAQRDRRRRRQLPPHAAPPRRDGAGAGASTTVPVRGRVAPRERGDEGGGEPWVARHAAGDGPPPDRVVAAMHVEVDNLQHEPPDARRRRLLKQRTTAAAERLKREREEVRVSVSVSVSVPCLCWCLRAVPRACSVYRCLAWSPVAVMVLNMTFLHLPSPASAPQVQNYVSDQAPSNPGVG